MWIAGWKTAGKEEEERVVDRIFGNVLLLDHFDGFDTSWTRTVRRG